MRRLFLIVFLVLGLSFAVSAQTWHPVNQVTVGWDAAERATSYKVFVKSVNDMSIFEVRATSDLVYTITFESEGRYFLGVQSVREVDEEIFYSTISWSDNSEVCFDGEAFGAIYYELPSDVGGLKVK